MSLQSFPQAGLFLSRQKILCRDRVCKGGVAKEFLVATNRPGLRARQSDGHKNDGPGHTDERTHQQRCSACDKADHMQRALLRARQA